MLKNANFFEKKNCKNCLSNGGSAPDPRLLPAAGDPPPDPALLLPPIITTLSSSFLVLNTFHYLLLPHVCTYFLLQTLQFLLRGAQEYFLPQGPGHPSYATASPCLIILILFLFVKTNESMNQKHCQ